MVNLYMVHLISSFKKNIGLIGIGITAFNFSPLAYALGR